LPDAIIRLEIIEAEALIRSALIRSGVSTANAASVARALVAAEVDGQKGHGFSRVAAYAAQARSGKVDGLATPAAERIAPACLRVDARNGFAFPAIDAAIDAIEGVAREMGMAGAAIVRSHHCGQTGAHVERLAERGLAALMVSNTPKAIAPWGGRRALFGTNPIAFAAPISGAPPLVIDMSLSKVARGKIMAASKAGKAIPEGLALDIDGNPTTDPKAALEGTMVPMGDAKGAALVLMVEVLSAALTGANFSYEATSFFDAEGAPPGVGHFMIAISPETALGASFAPRMAELVQQIESQAGARLPGTSRFVARKQAQAHGLEVAAHLVEEIRRLADPERGPN